MQTNFMSGLKRPVNKRDLSAWVNEQIQRGVPRYSLYLSISDMRPESDNSDEIFAFYEVMNSLLHIFVGRNLKGIAFEKQGAEKQAIALYEANVTDQFNGSHPYDRLRRIYLKACDYENVSRICHAYLASSGNDPVQKQSCQQQADGIARFFSPDINRELGNAEPVCPHCGNDLIEMPTKKHKCVSCHKDVYVRIRPIDYKGVVVTKEQAGLLDEQWAMVRGRYEEVERDKQRRSQVRTLLTEKFGSPPDEGDVEWKILNEDLLASSVDQNWPKYRDTRYSMARILTRGKKYNASLATLLEVCYLDINGPINVKDYRWRGVTEQFGPWTPKFGCLKSNVVKEIAKTMLKANITIEFTHDQFVECASSIKQALRLPVTADAAWEQLSSALKVLAQQS